MTFPEHSHEACICNDLDHVNVQMCDWHDVNLPAACTELVVLDKDGNPVGGERVQFDFVNDDGSLAPASGDLTPRSLSEVLHSKAGAGSEFGVHQYPQRHILGSRQSR